MSTKILADRVVALATIPALALGLFATPAFAFWGPQGVTTNISVNNENNATVTNTVTLNADTGYNTANGGNGAKGGKSGDSGSNAGDGGDAGKGGNGGDAEAEGGYAEGGDGGYGFDGGAGGNTGDTGNGGNGGNGGEGGDILTGDASVAVAISNEVNTNTTGVVVEDCGCDQYNESYETADEYFTRYERDRDHHDRRHNGDSDASFLETESHWTQYEKEFVPVTTKIDVDNDNDADVENVVDGSVNTGENVADGGDAGKGATSGDSGSDAGDGGEGGNGGNGGDAETYEDDQLHRGWGDYGYHDDSDDDGTAIAGDGGDGGFGAEGGDTGTSGNGGNGGDGARGGVIVTGYADSAAAIVNVVNKNITRIRR